MDPLTRAQLVDHLSAMTDTEYQAVQVAARPDLSTPHGRAAAGRAKAAQLMNLSREMDEQAIAQSGIRTGGIVPSNLAVNPNAADSPVYPHEGI